MKKFVLGMIAASSMVLGAAAANAEEVRPAAAALSNAATVQVGAFAPRATSKKRRGENGVGGEVALPVIAGGIGLTGIIVAASSGGGNGSSPN